MPESTLDPYVRSQRLRSISHLLKNPGLWPEDFVWDYRSLESCALGLAEARGFSMEFGDLGMREEDWDAIFVNVRSLGFLPKRFTTPRQVARAIDKFLA